MDGSMMGVHICQICQTYLLVTFLLVCRRDHKSHHNLLWCPSSQRNQLASKDHRVPLVNQSNPLGMHNGLRPCNSYGDSSGIS